MKKLFAFLLVLSLALCLSASALAAEDHIINETDQDMADFFSRKEREDLNARAEAIWEDVGVGVYFVLVDDTDGMSTGDYSEWYYLEHDFIPVDAIVMIANIEENETKVYADGDICLVKLVVEDLNDMKQAYDASDTYFGGVNDYLDVVEKKLGFDPVKALLIAAIVGLVAAVIVVLILRGQLRSVRAQKGAADYSRPGSLQITSRYEHFLYRHVDRTAKAKDNGSTGGDSAKTGGGLRSR